MNHATMLAEYYNKDLYPFELIFRMMTCNKESQSAESRVIAVQFQSDSNVFVMHDYPRVTYQALKRKMLVGSSRPPQSMHMAHFKEGSNNNNKFIHAQKELIFDMDITDFHRFCECRAVKRLCPICWCQMQGASLILQYLLEQILGYGRDHCLWVFSGGKGLHCFVNEPSAMKLGDKEREQLHKRLCIVAGDDARLIAFVTTLSKSAPEFVAHLQSFFLDHVLKEQDLFSLPVLTADEQHPTEDSFELACLHHLRIHHPALYHHIKGAWDTMASSPVTKKARLEMDGKSGGGETLSMRKWKVLLQLESLCKTPGTSYKPSLFCIVRFMYPMIDKGPLMLSHQIKLPFSVHSLTHNVALPLTQEAIMRMDIKKDLLSVEQLCRHFKTNKSVPHSFAEGVRLLGDWLPMYNNEEEEEALY